ncbi:MAG: ASKHA domain-containing protein [Anaerolineae bacterium]
MYGCIRGLISILYRRITWGYSSPKNRASSPTGPAFEGAQISSGMRATPGTIELLLCIRILTASTWMQPVAFNGRV